MDINPKITSEVVDCKYLKIQDTTVYTDTYSQSMYARAYFVECRDSTVRRVDFSNLRSLMVYSEIIKDGLHTVSMAISRRYNSAQAYLAGNIVAARPYSSGGGGGEITLQYEYSESGLKFYIATVDAPGILNGINDDWEEISAEYGSLSLFQSDTESEVVQVEEIVDCRIFVPLRIDCRKFEVSKSISANYSAIVYSLKSYIQNDPIYSFLPQWENDKAIFDFNQIAPADLSNIYIIKLIDPESVEDEDYIVIYDLCKAIECQNRLILELICKDCESCRPSKEEAYKRYSLNRMIAMFGSVMLNIHQSEFSNIGASTIDANRYNSIKDASEKLDMYLMLINRCGDCEEEFSNCEGC